MLRFSVTIIITKRSFFLYNTMRILFHEQKQKLPTQDQPQMLHSTYKLRKRVTKKSSESRQKERTNSGNHAHLLAASGKIQLPLRRSPHQSRQGQTGCTECRLISRPEGGQKGQLLPVRAKGWMLHERRLWMSG